jgi:hypothetical protein
LVGFLLAVVDVCDVASSDVNSFSFALSSGQIYSGAISFPGFSVALAPDLTCRSAEATPDSYGEGCCCCGCSNGVSDQAGTFDVGFQPPTWTGCSTRRCSFRLAASSPVWDSTSTPPSQAAAAEATTLPAYPLWLDGWLWLAGSGLLTSGSAQATTSKFGVRLGIAAPAAPLAHGHFGLRVLGCRLGAVS